MLELLANKYLPAAVSALLLAWLVGVVAWEGIRTRANRRLLEKLSRLQLDWDYEGEHDPDTRHLAKYLTPNRPRVGFPEDNRFLLRLPRLEVLEELSAGAKPRAYASLFTGIALFFTFVLIAYVLMTDVHGALTRFGDAARGTGGADPTIGASRELAHAVQGMGAKFTISATGVLCAVIYSVFVMIVEKWHAQKLDYVERAMRNVFASPGEYDSLLQRCHLDVLIQLREQSGATVAALQDLQGDVRRLSSIEVSVQNLSTDVTHQLRNILTKDLGEQIQGMMAQALDRIDAIATTARKTLVIEVEQAAASVGQAVPAIIANLDAIRVEVSRQAQAPVESLMAELNRALSQGYSGETAQLNTALRHFSEVVPEVARNLDAVGQRLVATVEAQHGRGEAASSKLFVQVEGLLAQLQGQQSAMAQSFGQVQSETLQATANLVRVLEAQVGSVADGFARVAAEQTGAMAERVQKVAAAQDDSLVALEQRMGSVVALLKAAEGALAGSAVALQGASTGSTQLISATEGAVTGLWGVAQQLTRESDGIRLILQESGLVLREAQKQAGVEKELTEGHRRLIEELQRVWPTLLDQYLKSFEEKSRTLASSWSDLHKNVGQLVDGTVSQLRDGAADLETAVDHLTKVLGTVRAP